MQSAQFEALKKQLDQSRSDLLTYLELLSQSGDMLAVRTKNNAEEVVKTSREYIIGISAGILLIFLFFGFTIAKNINRMAEKIRAQSEEMAKANKEITKAHADLKESNELVTESIGYASKIQQAIQSTQQELNRFCEDSFVLWQPRDIVGGDLYLIRPWGNGHLIFFSDCTGHGVPGALMTILAKSALEKALNIVEPGKTGKLITCLHQIIQSDLGQHNNDSIADDGLDLGVCFISKNRQKLTFSGAKLSLIYNADHGICEIKGDKSSIGYCGIDRNIQFAEHQIDLTTITKFYLLTDGMIDQVGGEKTISFGKRRLFKLIKESVTQPMSTQIDTFRTALNEYQGREERRDDVTVIGFTLAPENLSNKSVNEKHESAVI